MEKVKTRNIFPSQTLSYKHSASSFLIIISAIFLFVSIVVATVPISPTFPKAGLDPSWKFAMSYAIATHMDIGSGQMYYHNPTTNETSWKAPASLKGKESLWGKQFDKASRQHYYVNNETGHT